MHISQPTAVALAAFAGLVAAIWQRYRDACAASGEPFSWRKCAGSIIAGAGTLGGNVWAAALGATGDTAVLACVLAFTTTYTAVHAGGSAQRATGAKQ